MNEKFHMDRLYTFVVPAVQGGRIVRGRDEREADGPLGRMSYHFGTKDDLYTEVIGRRAEQHVADILAAMAAVRQRAGDGEA